MTRFMRFRNRHISNFILFCLSIIIALLLCEISLQFIFPSRGFDSSNTYNIWPPHLKKVFKPNPDIMPGIFGRSEFVVNSIGLRGDELTDFHSFRILTIGGSTTECLFLDQTETWPYLLQKNLNDNLKNFNVWVGNAGMSGKNSRHHLMAMQYLPLEKWKINVVVILLGINDFSLRISQGEKYDPKYLNNPGAKDNTIIETFTGTNFKTTDGKFYRKSILYNLFKNIKVAWKNKKAANVQDEEGKIFSIWREHRRHASMIQDDLPPLSSSIEEFSGNVNRIVDIAQVKSIRLIFVTQPAMWKPGLSKNLKDLLWFGGVGEFQKESGKIYYSEEALEKGIKMYNDALIRICNERNIECLDLANMLDKDTTVFYDDVHFNENGARIVANIISGYILSRPEKRWTN